MKTNNKTLALLFAVCTNQSIESVRPATKTQPTVRLDTVSSPLPTTTDDEQPVRPQRGEALTIKHWFIPIIGPQLLMSRCPVNQCPS